jgi:hypothetical protein
MTARPLADDLAAQNCLVEGFRRLGAIDKAGGFDDRLDLEGGVPEGIGGASADT